LRPTINLPGRDWSSAVTRTSPRQVREVLVRTPPLALPQIVLARLVSLSANVHALWYDRFLAGIMSLVKANAPQGTLAVLASVLTGRVSLVPGSRRTPETLPCVNKIRGQYT
jgi:hypothetical protein